MNDTLAQWVLFGFGIVAGMALSALVAVWCLCRDCDPFDKDRD